MLGDKSGQQGKEVLFWSAEAQGEEGACAGAMWLRHTVPPCQASNRLGRVTGKAGGAGMAGEQKEEADR